LQVFIETKNLRLTLLMIVGKCQLGLARVANSIDIRPLTL